MTTAKFNVERALREAGALAAAGEKAQAEALYRQVLERFPGNRRAIEALRAIGPGPADGGDLAALRERGNILLGQGRLKEAVASFDQALALDPRDIATHNNRGNALKNLGRLDEAAAAYAMVIRERPDIAVAHFNLGLAYKELGQLEQALASYGEALRLKPDLAEAHLNIGNVLRLLKRLDESIASFDQAIALRPGYVDAHNNRGLSLQELGRLEEAVASYDRALQADPAFVAAHNNRGSALQELQRPREAIASYEAALRLKPDFAAAFVQLLHQKAMICDWSAPANSLDLAALDLSMDILPPFQIMTIADDPALQLQAARTWTRSQSPITAATAPQPAPGAKLRIGYFSADFYNHATMFLIAGLLENHDRSRFEVHAFSYGPHRHDAMRRRAEAAVDHFHDIRHLDDAAAAQFARDHAIDIAIDLKGHTTGTRFHIFAYRPAPVQIAWLGYPGSMGADFIDYIIADRVVIPPKSRHFYSEKVIELPHSYQVNDSGRPIAGTTPSRADCGLPEQGFVFACFNNSYKITPAEFDIWMRLLGEVKGSVLWLFEGYEHVRSNLISEAQARGVDPARLIFAPKLPNSEHLARQRRADLFLDTFTVNAHTTASDALWAGLPVLTKAGKSFAARVAASLLHALDLSELIARSEAEYEERALALATNPARLAAIRTKLAANLQTAPLFDTEPFARHFETACAMVYRRHAEGLPPDHIVVPPS